jgi:hypothetical protein
MKHSNRMLNIEKARQQFYDALIDGVDMNNEDNSDKLLSIRTNLKDATETACFLDLDETLTK